MSIRSALDALAFSSLLAACVGFSLCLAIGRALESPGRVRGALLVGLGTFIIYNLDRLRDTARDRSTSPDRTAFIEQHRGTLTFALAVAAIVFGGLLFSVSRAVAALVVAVGLIGLFHRRLKTGAARKALYVSGAWLLACLGIPWLEAGRPDSALWAGAMIFPPLLANLAASNVRDGEHETFRTRPDRLVAICGAMTLLSVVAALLAPTSLRPLVWIPIAEWVALLGFRPGERYGHLVIDGALLVGSLAALAHFAVGAP